MGRIIDFREKKHQRKKEKEKKHCFLRNEILRERTEWEDLVIIEIYELFIELSLDNMERACRNLNLFLKRKKEKFLREQEKSDEIKKKKSKDQEEKERN